MFNSFKQFFCKEKKMKEQYVIQFGNGSYFKASRKTKCVETMEEATKFDSLEAVQRVYLRYGHLMTAFGARTLNIVDPVSNLFAPRDKCVYIIVFQDGRYFEKMVNGQVSKTRQIPLAKKFDTHEEANTFYRDWCPDLGRIAPYPREKCAEQKEREGKMKEYYVVQFGNSKYAKKGKQAVDSINDATFFNTYDEAFAIYGRKYANIFKVNRLNKEKREIVTEPLDGCVLRNDYGYYFSSIMDGKRLFVVPTMKDAYKFSDYAKASDFTCRNDELFKEEKWEIVQYEPKEQKEKKMKEQYVIRFGDGYYFARILKNKRIYTYRDEENAFKFDSYTSASDFICRNGELFKGEKWEITQCEQENSTKKEFEDKMVLKYKDGIYLKYNGGQTAYLSEARTFYNRESIYKYIKENNRYFIGVRWSISFIKDELRQKESKMDTRAVIMFEDKTFYNRKFGSVKALENAHVFSHTVKAEFFVKEHPELFIGRKFVIIHHDGVIRMLKQNSNLNIYYVEVRFPFGTYTFKTHRKDLEKNDLVLCEVRDAYNKGNVIQYVKCPTNCRIDKWVVCNFAYDYNNIEQTKKATQAQPFDHERIYNTGETALFGELMMRRTMNGWEEVKD